MVVPFSAGGPADITSRNLAPRLTELLGQPIVVDNRAGANGIIGAENVIRSAPDGYTLLMATASVAAINMVTYAKPPYDTLRDLQPLTPVMTTSSLIVIHPSLPAKTLKDFLALAKARPNQIAFGSAGVGADPVTMAPDEFSRFIRADIEKWGKLVKSAGIQVER